MNQVILRLTLINAEYYGNQPPEAVRPREVDVVCDPTELLAAAVRRTGVEIEGSRLWADYLTGDMGLWVVPASLAPHLPPLRTDHVGFCLLRPDLSAADAIAYFGPLITDRPTLAVYPAAPIGGDPLNILVDLAGSARGYLTNSSPWELINDALTIYGGTEVLLQIQRALIRHRLARLHKDARAWLYQERVTRRIARLIGSRDAWTCRRLAKVLGLDHLSTARLLDRCGYTLSDEDLETWARVTDD